MSESNVAYLTVRRNHLLWFTLAVVVLALGGLWLWHRDHTGRSEAVSRVGTLKEERVSFEVRSAGKSHNGHLLFLNDQRDYRGEGVFTVVIDTESVPEYAGVDPRSLVGKTVEATGIMGEYHGRPQVMVRDGTKLTVR